MLSFRVFNCKCTRPDCFCKWGFFHCLTNQSNNFRQSRSPNGIHQRPKCQSWFRDDALRTANMTPTQQHICHSVDQAGAYSTPPKFLGDNPIEMTYHADAQTGRVGGAAERLGFEDSPQRKTPAGKMSNRLKVRASLPTREKRSVQELMTDPPPGVRRRLHRRRPSRRNRRRNRGRARCPA